MDRMTMYRWRADDLEFAKAWDAALDIAGDMLEDEAIRRGFDGVLKPVYQGGVKVGSVREYSDGLAALLLKAHKPEKFRDRVELSGSINLAEQLAAARARAKPDGEGA